MNFSAISDYECHGRHLHIALVNRNKNKLTLQVDDDVLDVGCGTGVETKSIAAEVKSVTGIDSSKEMIAFARANNSAPNVTYSLGDAQTIGDCSEWQERFDKAVSFFVLHWCPDHAMALRSILACLKPGGEALFIVCNRSSWVPESVQFVQNHIKWSTYGKDFKSSCQFWNMSVSEAEKLLASCGWKNVRCELQHHGQITEEPTKAMIKSGLGISAQIPESEMEEYLRDMWQWTLSQYGDSSKPGHVRIPAEIFIIQACKSC
ncbi:uncharacterized protein LOC110989548 [Acanthaster planci]|uniref:Uncharacterized protein LOC110989548 n=1 Tax=Acanthaster planci TaxID=133434 RepID=A0A8B7ZY86_ACAPL|nr:uncharacterized protein LOC110989548 [Acanthaster planci]